MRMRSDRHIHVGALHLVEMADRVLGSDASPREKYVYLSGLLSRLGSAIEPRETSCLRVECFRKLFEEDPDDSEGRLSIH